MNLPHSSATLPHLTRLVEATVYEDFMFCPHIIFLSNSPSSPDETQTSQTLQASQPNQFFASMANSSHSSGEHCQHPCHKCFIPSICRSFILSRPARGKLKKRGILRERVFGCDLGEHLLNSGNEGATPLKLGGCHK